MKDFGATFVEYLLILVVFLAIFVAFGNVLKERIDARAEFSQQGALVPCVALNESEYLLGSKSGDRDLCSN